MIVSAIEIAGNPTSDRVLHTQATEYCNQLRAEQSAWEPCLSIFTKTPRYPDIVRIFALEIVNSAIHRGAIDGPALRRCKDELMNHLGRIYFSDKPLPLETIATQNKVGQTLTCLFSALYGNGWETFFDDMLSFTGATIAGGRDNVSGTIFYLQTILFVHEDIGDQLIPRSRAEQDHANILKDKIRERDVQKIANSWQEILQRWRTNNQTVVELCLKVVSRWVSWVNVGLVVNQPMLGLLFDELARIQTLDLTNAEGSTSNAAVVVLCEITGKKMQPSEKLEIISFLNLESVVSQLIASPPLNERRNSSKYDTDLAETVARLVNITLLDVIKILETETSKSSIWQRAERFLYAFLPHVLRFFADEYDEVCSTVIPALSEFLGFLRRTSQDVVPTSEREVVLIPVLKAIFAKMRYDDSSPWGGEQDETDEAEFQELRLRLRVLQEIIAAVDEQLYVDAVTNLIKDIFDNGAVQGTNLSWRDLDLALSEMMCLGGLAVKSGGLYQKKRATSKAAHKIKQLMQKMVEIDFAIFSHPATQLQYMDLCVRYCPFFENNAHYARPVLENFLRIIHHSAKRVKSRAWYLFLRFVRQLRFLVGELAERILHDVTDLLPIKAEVSELSDADEASSEDHNSMSEAMFNNQLFLYEAVGCVCGAPSLSGERQAFYVHSILSPLFADMEQHLQAARGGDERANLQIHHDVMALGTLARGFSDWVPGGNSAAPASAAIDSVRAEFARASEATLVALKSLRTSLAIRTAARSTLSRLIGVLGVHILPQFPDWIDGLLTEVSTREEMALFLRLLEQVIFGFKNEVLSILDQIFTRLLQRVFAGFAGASAGTDDHIQVTELKLAYLNLLTAIMNNGLGSVVISPINQPFFESVIATIEHFAMDVEDANTARMAFQTLTKMCIAWAGPDVVAESSPTTEIDIASPLLPGFDHFMMTRFSPLCWAAPMQPSFNTGDAQARQVLGEAAVLQKTIYRKCGQRYLSWLGDVELNNVGISHDAIVEYLSNLVKLEQKAFKAFFQNFIIKGGA